MEEVWKDIEELKNAYQVSNFGRVRRKSRKVPTNVPGQRNGLRNLSERITKSQDNGHGYQQIYVKIDGIRIMVYLHRIVAIYFLPNPENKPEVNHKDGNKENNRADNLEWATRKENVKHAVDNNLLSKGEKVWNCKLTEQKILAIRRLHRMNPNFNRAAINRKLGLGNSTVSKIIKKTRWKHI